MRRIAVVLLVLALVLGPPPLSATPQESEASVELYAASDGEFLGSVDLHQPRTYEGSTCFHVNKPLNLPSPDPFLSTVIYRLEDVTRGCKTTGPPVTVPFETAGISVPRIYWDKTDEIHNNRNYGDCMPFTSLASGAKNSILDHAVVIYSMKSPNEEHDFRQQDHKHSPLACGMIHSAGTSKDYFLKQLNSR